MLIEGTMTDAQGRVTEFQVDADEYMQWGAPRDVLGDRVGVLGAIEQVLAEYEEGDL